MPGKKFLIIGNSVSAVAAIEGIRRFDQDSEVTVLSKEPYLAYSRPIIADYLMGLADDYRMLYRDERFYKNLNVKLELGEEVVSVEPSKNKIITASGKKYNYDYLLIATGGKPFVPPMEGFSDVKEGVFTFTSWDDAKKIKEHLPKVKKFVVVGAGFIGLELAEALIHLGKEVVVIELADRPLVRALDEFASSQVKDYFESIGVKFYLNDTVKTVISSNGVFKGVELKSGEKIEAEAMAVAIGVRPNVDFLKDSGIEIDRGVVIDDKARTSVENIFAAGDVAQGWDVVFERKQPLPLWVYGYRQGIVAGINMAGGDAKYPGGFPMNSLKFRDVPAISGGIVAPQDKENYIVKTAYDPRHRFYRKIVVKESKLVGFVNLWQVDGAGIFTGIVLSGIDVSELVDDMLKPDFGWAHMPRWWREKNLEGVRWLSS